MARHYLKSRGYEIFQADWIGKGKDGQYILFEIKHQEYFRAPPFDGHGLPLHQVKARTEFWKQTRIRCAVVIFEKGEDFVYLQWLDVLEAGKHIESPLKSRRIYPLGNFIKRPFIAPEVREELEKRWESPAEKARNEVARMVDAISDGADVKCP